MPLTDIFLLVATGAIGGFLSGLLGVGGGIIFVPALVFVLSSIGIDPAHIMHIAVGSSMAVVLATGASSAFGHHKKKSVDKKILLSWGPFIVSGVIIGAIFASLVDGDLLRKIFAAITLLISFYMGLGREKTAAVVVENIFRGIQKCLCIVIGAISSMIGVGGAMLTAPMMHYIGVPTQKAVGTSAALSVLISLPGTVIYILSGLAHRADLPPWSLGYVDFAVIGFIIPVSMLMVPIGVQTSHLLPKILLRRIFGVMLFIVSIRMFMSL